MGGPATKYTFDGIGGASATIVLAALALNPSTAWMAGPWIRPITNFLLTGIFSALASVGLVILNVGAAAVEELIDEHNFDGTEATAQKLVDAIRQKGQTITPEQAKAIDDPVIAAFRKFASFARQST